MTDVFRRVATASDAGAAVTVAWAEVDHATVQMLVYRGTNASNPVVSATVAMAGSGTSIKTPAGHRLGHRQLGRVVLVGQVVDGDRLDAAVRRRPYAMPRTAAAAAGSTRW